MTMFKWRMVSSQYTSFQITFVRDLEDLRLWRDFGPISQMIELISGKILIASHVVKTLQFTESGSPNRSVGNSEHCHGFY